ncbi:MAG TPA: hypothetical protein VGB13_08510 [Candidatus Krumholzibacteria bacterium]|jgi:hypothetical protein
MMSPQTPLRRLTVLPAILALSALFLLGGCGIFSPDEPSDGGGGTGGGYTNLKTPDDVLTNLIKAYNDRDYDKYDELRHESFEFQFPVDEFDLALTANGRWQRERDSGSTQGMFEGSPSKDGEIVQSIDLSMVADPIPWSDNVETEFDGTQRRTYTVRMDVTVSGGTIYQVRGKHEFYVAPVGSGDNTQYKLRFWRDNGVELTKLADSTR